MQINLGYVGNPSTLLDIYSHNLTFKEFSKYDNDKGIDLLTERIRLNFKNFENVLKYNYDNKIKFYRMTHTMFPLLTHPNVNIDYKEVFKDDMEFYHNTKNMLINSLIYEKGSSLTYFLNLEQFYKAALERKYQYVKTAICKKHRKRKH